MEPAKTIIELCGGLQAVAEVTGRSVIRVRRWCYPAARGGSDGLIPAEAQQKLMAAAQAKGWPLRPEHFFPGSAGPPDKDVA